MKMFPVFGLLVLGACASQPQLPIVKTVEVKVPVTISCVPSDLPAAPIYPDTAQALIAQPTPTARLRLLEEGWGLRDTRISLLESLMQACRRHE